MPICWMNEPMNDWMLIGEAQCMLWIKNLGLKNIERLCIKILLEPLWSSLTICSLFKVFLWPLAYCWPPCSDGTGIPHEVRASLPAREQTQADPFMDKDSERLCDFGKVTQLVSGSRETSLHLQLLHPQLVPLSQSTTLHHNRTQTGFYLLKRDRPITSLHWTDEETEAQKWFAQGLKAGKCWR